MFQNHEDGIPCKTGIAPKRRPDQGTFYHLLHFPVSFQNTGEKTEWKVYLWRDHQNTPGDDDVPSGRKDGIPAGIYTNRHNRCPPWSLWIPYRLWNPVWCQHEKSDKKNQKKVIIYSYILKYWKKRKKPMFAGFSAFMLSKMGFCFTRRFEAFCKYIVYWSW